MAEQKEHEAITIEAVSNLLVEAGYETTSGREENCLFVKEPESGLTVTCVLENNILFNTMACIEIEEPILTPEMMRMLLDSENGISTSNFQLIRSNSGKIIITLNNFCKLQDLGPEDRDDVLSCLGFLDVDVLAARDLLSNHL